MFAWEQRKLGEVFNQTLVAINPEIENVELWSLTIEDGLTHKTARYNRQFLVKKEDNFKKVFPGDIVYNPMNMTLGAVGFNYMDIPVAVSGYYVTMQLNKNYDNCYFAVWLKSPIALSLYKRYATGSLTEKQRVQFSTLSTIPAVLPGYKEQQKIGAFFQQLDSLITLHQRKPFIKNGGIKMITSNFTCDSLFKDYFEFWIKLYKEGAVRPVTLEKYRNNQKHIAKIIPNLKMKDFDRNAYQELLNQYALTHERQTVIDFHHQVKGAILDAVDDGLIDRDPTRKAIFKGKAPREKKQKYLNQFELHNLLEDLDLGMEVTWDWLILLIAKTGLRFSEALGLTPADFDFARQTISVNKTWDYKTNTGFQPTKNRSSIRKVQMDWQLGMQFQHLIKNLNEDEPIFVNGPVCNSTPNNCLARHCRKCGIPEISIHGLRHTHASLLMFAGVSIASVSRRLGHSSITTTQKVYMHIINELENQDNDLVMRYLSSLS